MSEIKIISHKSPDTDAVCASIVFQNFLEQKGKKSTPIKLGNLNKETKFVLDFCGIQEPETILGLEEGTKIALVDHNEKSQSIENIGKYEIEYLVDHHKIGDFSTSGPVFIRTEQLGSTNSILYKMFKENGFEISQKIATLMLSAIVSDTLNFRSATTTREDVQIGKELNKIAKIEHLGEFVKNMFDAKSDLTGFSIEEIIKSDYKNFDFNGIKAGIGTLETTNPKFSLDKKTEILEGLQKIKHEDNLDFILLSVVDILEEKNISFVLDGNETKVVENIFGTKIENNLADLGKRLSRKKQIVPDLDKYFS
ncbi:manganese-dependent inorganic pyrophosphatase [Candidatus Gracilibacteria bacterium]|nr:manganese-dependent inorganic pyrophosphatase [Candidatus Gracilibacteria bacterium]